MKRLVAESVRGRARPELVLLLLGGALCACSSTLVIGDPPSEVGDATPAGTATGLPEGDHAAAPLDWNTDWEWLAPHTTTQTLLGGWAAAADDIWLVGERGTVLRWDGATRARVAYQGPLLATYRAIAASDRNDVWVAGDHAALHFNGTSWTESVKLAAYDVRSLVRYDGGVAALTTDGSVLALTSGGGHVASGSHVGVLDVTAASEGGYYVLKRDGVDWVRPSQGSTARVASFTQTLPLRDARLFGDRPSLFRYLLGYESATHVSYAFFDGDPSAAASFVVSERLSTVARAGSVVERAGTDRAFLRLGDQAPWFFDGTRWRASSSTEQRARGALRLPSGETAVVGKKGLVATVVPDQYSLTSMSIVPRGGSETSAAVLFEVAPDGSAWAARQTLRGNRRLRDGLGVFEEASGWQWHSIPQAYLEIASIAPLARTSVWLTLRTTNEPSEYHGGSTLAHWNGASFDSIRPAPKPLRVVRSDGESGFFALALDGTLFHAGADGVLAPLGDAGTAGESPFTLCDPLLAPTAGGKTFILDQVCQLSFWDGAALTAVPSLRGAEHGTGHISFSMWASGPSSLWVTDPHRGLSHFDGKKWTLVWESQLVPYGVWGVDDQHVWFVDQPWQSSGKGGVLMRWDGKTARTVASTPGATLFGGNRDSVWLSGEATLRLRAARSSADTH